MNPYFSLPNISREIVLTHLDIADEYLASCQCSSSIAQYLLSELEQGNLEIDSCEILLSTRYRAVSLEKLESMATKNRGALYSFSDEVLNCEVVTKNASSVDKSFTAAAYGLIDLIDYSSLIDVDKCFEFMGKCDDPNTDVNCYLHKQLYKHFSPYMVSDEDDVFDLNISFFFGNRIKIISFESRLLDVSNLFLEFEADYAIKQLMIQTLSLMSSVFGIMTMPMDYSYRGYIEEGIEEYKTIKELFFEKLTREEVVEKLLEDRSLCSDYNYFSMFEDCDSLSTAFERIEFAMSLESDGCLRLPEGFHQDPQASARLILNNIANTAMECDLSNSIVDVCRTILLEIQENGAKLRENMHCFKVEGENGDLSDLFITKIDSSGFADEILDDMQQMYWQTGLVCIEALDCIDKVERFKQFEQRLRFIGMCTTVFYKFEMLNNSLK